jgi:putative sigma-54 modulation protein
MQIEVKGRHMTISDDIRDHVEKRFAKVGKQVSELATLEVELWEHQNPSNPDSHVCADELAVQVKRHRDKRRKRRESRAAATQPPGMASEGISAAM